MAAPLIGAEAEETVVTGSTTSNLHQLISTFFKPQGTMAKILADELAFPTDIYVLQSQLRLKGLDPDEHLVQVTSKDGRLLVEVDIIAKMTDEIALGYALFAHPHVDEGTDRVGQYRQNDDESAYGDAC